MQLGEDDLRTDEQITADMAQTVKLLASLYDCKVSSIAKALDRSTAATYARLNGTTPFTPAELYKLALLFGVSVGVFYRTPDEVERLISDAMRDLGSAS